MKTMNIRNIREKKRDTDRRRDVLSAIAALDPHSRDDLICHLQALNAAHEAKNVAEQDYAARAIAEIFGLKGAARKAPELAAWETEGASPAAKAAIESLDRETKSFFENYDRLKRARKLPTIRAVAKAAGLSPATVQAIEKQRVKPQLATRRALARAFNVKVDELDR